MSKREESGFTRSSISAYDLPTQDKIPVIRELMAATGGKLALDIGVGTGYTTYSIFGELPTVCVDLHAPNLIYYRDHVAWLPEPRRPLCVVAPATSLPFEAGTFHFILCSEVLEHLEDDDAAAGEIARVLADDGRAVITVPYSGLGFTSFLELCGIKTVHDFPGPEHHVRPGYDEQTLRSLLARHGLEIERHAFYLRFFTRVVVDMVGFAHLLYQRLVHGRRAWTWSDAAEAESGIAFKLYRSVFPLLLAASRIDRLLGRRRGFGLVASVRKSLPGGKDSA